MHSRALILSVCVLAVASQAQVVSGQNSKRPGQGSDPQNNRPNVAQQVVNADFNQVEVDDAPAKPAEPKRLFNEQREAIPLKRPDAADGGAAAANSGGLSPLVALVIVVVLIVVVAKLLKKRESSLGGAFAGEVFDMLGRMVIDARNSISLVRVGDKIIVIGLSPTGMNALSEITDRAEVERLTNLSRASSSEPTFDWLSWIGRKKNTSSETIAVEQRLEKNPKSVTGTNSAHEIPTGLSIRELEEGGHVR
jgi:flagellar biogenesis protein FliO